MKRASTACKILRPAGPMQYRVFLELALKPHAAPKKATWFPFLAFGPFGQQDAEEGDQNDWASSTERQSGRCSEARLAREFALCLGKFCEIIVVLENGLGIVAVSGAEIFAPSANQAAPRFEALGIGMVAR